MGVKCYTSILIKGDLTSGECVIIDMEFQVGDLVALINLAKKDYHCNRHGVWANMSPLWHPY